MGEFKTCWRVKLARFVVALDLGSYCYISHIRPLFDTSSNRELTTSLGNISG